MLWFAFAVYQYSNFLPLSSINTFSQYSFFFKIFWHFKSVHQAVFMHISTVCGKTAWMEILLEQPAMRYQIWAACICRLILPGTTQISWPRVKAGKHSDKEIYSWPLPFGSTPSSLQGSGATSTLQLKLHSHLFIPQLTFQSGGHNCLWYLLSPTCTWRSNLS